MLVAGWHVIQVSLAQSLGLARVAETAGEGWLFGPRPLDEKMLEHHHVSAVFDEGLLHVLLMPPGTWVSLDRAGAEVGRQQASRAEVMTIQLRASQWWASMRRLLEERGVEPATAVVGDAFDDDEDHDEGVLVTPSGAVIAWRRRYDDERPDADRLVGWDDITDAWRDGPWRDAVKSALAVQANGLSRLRPPGPA